MEVKKRERAKESQCKNKKDALLVRICIKNAKRENDEIDMQRESQVIVDESKKVQEAYHRRLLRYFLGPKLSRFPISYYYVVKKIQFGRC